MRILIILAFMLALGSAIPLLNIISPYSASYQSKVPASSFNAPLVIQAAGCSSVNTTGQNDCTAGLSAASNTGGSSIFGSIVSTVLVFGNFFAAAQFLVTVASGVVLPGQYVFEWLTGPGDQYVVALGVAGLFQALVWLAYAEGFVYIVSGRWLE